MRLNAIGLICADIEASLTFYRMVGVDFPERDSDQGHQEAEIGAGIRLMLDTYEVAAMLDDDFEPPQRNEVVSFAVECDEPRDVDAAYGRITAAGHPGVRAPFDAFWGQRYATVSDPDGNHVDLYAALE